MVAWGTFDRLGPMLFFIDTGGKNAGFLPAIRRWPL